MHLVGFMTSTANRQWLEYQGTEDLLKIKAKQTTEIVMIAGLSVLPVASSNPQVCYALLFSKLCNIVVDSLVARV